MAQHFSKRTIKQGENSFAKLTGPIGPSHDAAKKMTHNPPAFHANKHVPPANLYILYI
jgi:hypothetical protein